MATKIIISSDEPITCPKDHHQFPLQQGIRSQTIGKYEKEFEEESEKRGKEIKELIEKDARKKAAREFAAKQGELEEKLAESGADLQRAKALAAKAQKDASAKAEEFEKREKALKDQVEKEVRKKAAKEFAAEKSALEEKLAESDADLKRTQALAAKIQKEAVAKARAELAPEKKAIEEELEQKSREIKASKEREFKLIQDKKKLQQSKDDLELENQRTLDQERKKILDEAAKREAAKTHFKEAEFRKKLEDVQRVNDELTRKLEQGSQQLQGEVLELELEGLLRSAFPLDKIEPVIKGAHGADILQRVHNQDGQTCGTIIWEAKRAENWSDKWLQKLKDDQMREGAEIAAIVTTNLPKDSKEPFLLRNDVWIVSHTVVRPIAEMLRVILIRNNNLKVANTGKEKKMELLYIYLCSPQFAQRIRAVVETFSSMKQTLDQERNAMGRIWKKREKDIERVHLNMMEMCGELHSISQGSLQQLEQIEQLSLPSGDEAGIEN